MGRKTGDNLLSHLSGEALPSADCSLNERVRDGYVCFPAPILTRELIPEPDVRVIAYTSRVSGKSVNSSSSQQVFKLLLAGILFSLT